MDLNDTVAEAVFVYSTFPDLAQAKQAANKLVRNGLAACVNILPGMVSLYMWEGVVEEADEVVFIVKTVSHRAKEVMAEIGELHPYEEPALLVLPTVGGSESYLAWIAEATSGTPDALS